MPTYMISFPDTSLHVNVPMNAVLTIHISGSTFGYVTKLFKTVEGKAEEATPVGQATADENGNATIVFESGSELYAYAYDGNWTGDKHTWTAKEYDNLGSPTGLTDTFVTMMKPGYGQVYMDYIPAGAAAGQDKTSKSVKEPGWNLQAAMAFPNLLDLSIKTGAGESGPGAGPGSSAGGGCCGCSTAGMSNSTSGQHAAFNVGGIVLSRGLPMLFSTVHVGNEKFEGPWGKYRSLGVYRKLLEQVSPFAGHVSIVCQDGSRVSYLKSGNAYIRAAGRLDSLVKTDTGWFEKTKEGIYYEYNAHGNLKRAFDPNRNQRYYVYDSSTSSQGLTEIKADKALRPYFYYGDPVNSSLNTKIALRDPADPTRNKYIYFEYDAAGYMTKVIGAEGCTWFYQYDGSGAVNDGKITKITDPDGYQTYYGFDGAG